VGQVRSSLPWIVAGILIGVGAGILFYFGFGPGRERFETKSNQGIAPAVPELNQKAPDFSLISLQGDKVKLTELRGKAVVLNFWATWCGPCRMEMPLLQAYADEYQADLVILPINNDETPATIQKFVDELGLRLDMVLDPGAKVTQAYRVRGFPTTIFIDKDGIIRFQHIGVLNEDLLLGYLQGIGALE
jgi:thiol-disulfide isomerase/thioredoxin